MGMHDGHREKLRHRFAEGGAGQFTDCELLELLLFYAIPRRDTNDLAHRLLEQYGSLSGVLSAPAADLQQVEGIGESAAVLVKLAPELCRRAKDGAKKETVLSSTEAAGRYLTERFAGESSEAVYQLCLDRKGKLLVCRRIGDGGLSSAGFSVRKLVENAVLTAASGVILSHNHPSGIALPSREDYGATEQAARALDAVGVPLLDHIIVADGDFVSMADSGLMPKG